MNQAHATEAVFPIRVVAERTGVNPVTLRAWERRHGLIRPKRTAKGHRLYSDHDIHTISRITDLLEQGVAISRVKEMLDSSREHEPDHRPQALDFEGAAAPAPGDTWEGYCRRMVTAVSNFDEPALEVVYSEALSLYPVDMVTQLLLLPLLHELETRWTSLPQATAEKGFFHSYLRTKLGARLHHTRTRGGTRLLLAGMPGEHAETDLLMLALDLRSAGYHVILLGADCQLDSLTHAIKKARAAGLVLQANLLLTEQLLSQLERFCQGLDCPVLMAGNCADAQRDALRTAGLTTIESDAAGAPQAIRQTLAEAGVPAG